MKKLSTKLRWVYPLLGRALSLVVLRLLLPAAAAAARRSALMSIASRQQQPAQSPGHRETGWVAHGGRRLVVRGRAPPPALIAASVAA